MGVSNSNQIPSESPFFDALSKLFVRWNKQRPSAVTRWPVGSRAMCSEARCTFDCSACLFIAAIPSVFHPLRAVQLGLVSSTLQHWRSQMLVISLLNVNPKQSSDIVCLFDNALLSTYYFMNILIWYGLNVVLERAARYCY